MFTIIPIKLTIEINNSKIEYSFNTLIEIPDKQEKEILDCVIIDNKENDKNDWIQNRKW